MSVAPKQDPSLALAIENVSIAFHRDNTSLYAVKDLSLQLRVGETYALLGESGCGKSITALAIMRLLPRSATCDPAGRIWFGHDDLLSLPEVAMRQVRGKKIAIIFQEPMTSLNPVMTIGAQIAEVVNCHSCVSVKDLIDKVIALLKEVGLPSPEKRYHQYPHQLSGGMKQRVMIAIALAAEPEVLIADEPTTALDVTIQAQVMNLLAEIQQKRRMTILLITHDLGIVRNVANRVGIMYAGHIVEEGTQEAFYKAPKHPYSQRLFSSLPDMSKRDHRLASIQGSVESVSSVDCQFCRFVNRCEAAFEVCNTIAPAMLTVNAEQSVRCHHYDANFSQRVAPVTSSLAPLNHDRSEQGNKSTQEILQVRNLQLHFPILEGLFKRVVGWVKAVDGVDLTIQKGKTLALVGESGCGKTTVGQAILQLIKPTGGDVIYDQVDLTKLSGAQLRKIRHDIQIIFQDPFSSMNPRMKVGDIIAEGLMAQGERMAVRHKKVMALLDKVGLPQSAINRYPHEFSGGQRQRVSIARSLAVEPKLIICDEPTSALDVSVQAQILNLLHDLQQQMQLTYLFITHNIAVVGYLAHSVAVMYLGRIVESGPCETVLTTPKHPYTQALLKAVPKIHAVEGSGVIKVVGELPSPLNPPSGCHFHPRCPHAMPVCRGAYPKVSQIGAVAVRCYLYADQTHGEEAEILQSNSSL